MKIVRTTFRENGRPEIAPRQMAYMRYQFDFYGLKAPVWLAYRDKTNAELLFRNIGRLADSQEFFIQKGAGWALRQYAKTDPVAVLEFVRSHRLAPLTRREALKHLPKKPGGTCNVPAGNESGGDAGQSGGELG